MVGVKIGMHAGVRHRLEHVVGAVLELKQLPIRQTELKQSVEASFQRDNLPSREGSKRSQVAGAPYTDFDVAVQWPRLPVLYMFGGCIHGDVREPKPLDFETFRR